MVFKYPETLRQPVTDDYFGTKVVDPYRWLEDDNSAETGAWVKAENKVTEDYLSAVPFRDQIRRRLEELWNYPKYGSPFKKGNWYYFTKNDGLQNQAVLYRQSAAQGAGDASHSAATVARDIPDAVPEVFFDPNQLSPDGTIALGGIFFSKSGKYVGYTISSSGSDWSEAYIKEADAPGFSAAASPDADAPGLPADHLRWLKFTGLAWKGDEGFYYSRYPEPDEKARLVGQNEYQKVYYHRVGTPQSENLLIFEDNDHPRHTVNAGLTEDNRFLCLSVSEGTSGAELLVRDLLDPAASGFTVLIPGFATEASVIDNDGDKLLVMTNDGAPNYQLVLIDPRSPQKENWVTVIPEQPDVLTSVSTGGEYLFAEYLRDASSRVYQYTYQGKPVREIELPGIGTAADLGGEKEDAEFFYTYTSFNYPLTIFRYDIASGKSTLFRKTEMRFDPERFETRQVFFASGARVPMFLTYRKGLELNGQNPVLLYGYGGFNVPLTPSFGISNLFFMEQGGIYAQVSLRGGSEYGEAWHEAGMLHNKQNVFDDMIGAAEYLIAHQYTRKDKIAIRGGSNGGLLVGACMTQRPELFKVAIPQVGVLDMLRFQRFTIGWAWVVEYGSSDNPEDFANLYRYSPYHNLRPGTVYPATLIVTGDHDDRVVPAHSFKFAARLQEMNAGPNPVLIRIDTKAGHGAGKPTSKVIDEAADIWSFVMYNLGMQYQSQSQ